MRSLSIVVPVYDEKELLAPSIAVIDSFLRKNFSDYEILLIESGSTDGSGGICDALGDENPRIRVIHEGARNGFGSALKVGYKKATKDAVWLVTVDLPFPLDAILTAMPLLDQYDVVLSYRSSDERGLKRKILSIGYNTLMKTILGLRVRHINSAFKLFKRDIIQSLPLVSNGWFIDAEILYWLRRKNIKTVEIPVPVIDRTAGKSSVSPWAPFFIVGEALKFVLSDKKHD